VYTSSIATVAPRLSLALHEYAAKDDRRELTRLMNDFVIPLYALRAPRKGYEVAVMKEMMHCAGLAAGPVRPPLPNLRPAEVEQVKKMMTGWKEWL
jgi:5-dehydro-4-deoxyglucarate dehydratase